MSPSPRRAFRCPPPGTRPYAAASEPSSPITTTLSGATPRLLRAHEHGHGGVVDDALGDAAHDQALHGPVPPAAHDHEVRPDLPGEVEHLVHRGTLPEVRARDLRAGLTEQRHLRLEQLPRLRQEPGRTNASKRVVGTVCQACATCSSAPALIARSTAARAARAASSEPSVASKIRFGRAFACPSCFRARAAHASLSASLDLSSRTRHESPVPPSLVLPPAVFGPRRTGRAAPAGGSIVFE